MKKWYQSKIFLLAATLAIVGLGQLATNWIGGQISPEQFAIIQQQYPAAAEGIKKAIEGNNYFGIITVIAGFLTGIWRFWFTPGARLTT